MADAELAFDLAWQPGSRVDTIEGATFASLTIRAGRDRIPVTEIDDVLAQTVRPSIHVPTVPLAQWLVVNWWRLRWEPRADATSPGWLRAHSMASISPDVPWPALQITSDGAFIHLEARAERIRDVAAIRYLRDVDVSVPAAHFEHAVDGFLAQLDARISSCVPGYRDLADLVAELREERADPRLARACKLQALAGFDPGVAPDEWVRGALTLADYAGRAAGDEVIAAIPTLLHGLRGATEAVEAMKRSTASIQLESPSQRPSPPTEELPWQRGRRMAALYRAAHSLGDGPVPNDLLGRLLDVALPLAKSPGVGDRALRGGYRNGVTNGRTRVVVTSDLVPQQRFYLGRLIGASLLSAPGDHVVPVTNAPTAYQKFERSFAQELLCPWNALDEYTDLHGTDDEGVASAAAHFIVSEYLVLSTLVNNDKLGRHRLPSTGSSTAQG